MKFLKQSTSTVICLGPCLSPSDGVTLVTSLAATMDDATVGIRLSKAGGSSAVRHASVTTTTYDAFGYYLVTLDATDTGTVGRLRVMFSAPASTLPIWEDFTVLTANVYDALIGGSVGLKVDVDTVKTQTVTCAAAVTMLASVGTAAASTAQTGDSYARIGAPAGASISADIAAKPSASGVAVAVVDQALSGHTTTGTVGKALSDAAAGGGGGGSDPWLTALPGAYSAGTAGAILGGYVAPNNTSIAAIKAKTDNLPAAPAATGDIPTADANADALLDRTAGVETGRTLRQSLRLMLAALAGRVSGGGTVTATFRDTNNTKNRIVATVDADGNRTAITYDAS